MLVSGTNAIIINATTTSNVVLRGLDIEGLGTGLVGIKVLAARLSPRRELHDQQLHPVGIDFVPSSATATTSQLHVSNSIIRNNNGATAAESDQARPYVSAVGMIENTQLRNNLYGLRVEDKVKATAKEPRLPWEFGRRISLRLDHGDRSLSES